MYDQFPRKLEHFFVEQRGRTGKRTALDAAGAASHVYVIERNPPLPVRFHSERMPKGASGETTSLRRNQIAAAVIFLCGIILVVAGLDAYLILETRRQTESTAVKHATEFISHFQILREYYTKNVVQKVRDGSDLAVDFDHEKKARTIPLPASMIHDISSLIDRREGGSRIKLYSEFPFPSRRDRKLDAFAVAAIAYLKANPNAAYSTFDTGSGTEIIRVAVADRMLSKACVDCHNTHPLSPRRDWKIGDVRGVLEVATPVREELRASQLMVVFVTMIALVILAIMALYIFGLMIRVNRGREKTEEVLRGIVAARTRELQSIQHAEELERITYTISHDLKSPLVTIQSYAGFLKENIEAGRSDEVARDIHFVTKAALKMTTLLDDLLSFSRIGRMSNRPERCNLKELIQDAVDVTSGRLKLSGAVVEISADEWFVVADALRMVQVFQNLLDNAAKFTVGVSAPVIRVGVRETSKGPVVYVEDNGIGMEKRYLTRVFGLFEKLHQGGEGTGVGLAIVKRIVEFHGGRIWAESPGLGHGSGIYFTLADLYQAHGDSGGEGTVSSSVSEKAV